MAKPALGGLPMRFGVRRWRLGAFELDRQLVDAFQGPDAIAFSKGFNDQFLTDDAEESAKEAFYREGPKLPR